jgi:hypothetical protein
LFDASDSSGWRVHQPWTCGAAGRHDRKTRAHGDPTRARTLYRPSNFPIPIELKEKAMSGTATANMEKASELGWLRSHHGDGDHGSPA